MSYEADRLDVYKDLKGDGKRVTLRVPGGSTSDPVTGEVTAETSEDYSTRALGLSYELSDIDGTLVKRGDLCLMMAALADDGRVLPRPLTTHLLYIGDTSGKPLSIVSVQPFAPGNVDIYYEIQGRA